MIVTQKPGARPIKMWLNPKQHPDGGQFGNEPDIEEGAMQQAKDLATLPFIHKNGVVLMPDTHWGKGTAIGSVIATEHAILPAAVGVDLGCGMNAVKLTLKADQLEKLALVRAAIEKAVPVGNAQHQHPNEFVTAWAGTTAIPKVKGYDDSQLIIKALRQMGSLGGGNHFIELCIDENNDVWVMLHSGSRGVGNIIGTAAITAAKEHMARNFIELASPDLAFFPEHMAEFTQYMADVKWAQDYALNNRKAMMELVIAAIRSVLSVEFTTADEAINCHHNYVERENHFDRNLWVTRKGAIRAREGDLGIIPGSMGQKSYIVRGKGNPESYCSCSHGAGRKMGRNEAKRLFNLADMEAQTAGVECRKDSDVIDEIPGAYKDLDLVMANQSDLVSIVHTLKAVLCVKG